MNDVYQFHLSVLPLSDCISSVNYRLPEGVEHTRIQGYYVHGGGGGVRRWQDKVLIVHVENANCLMP